MVIIEALLDHTPHCAQYVCDQYLTEQMQNSGMCAGNELKIWTPTATLYPPFQFLLISWWEYWPKCHHTYWKLLSISSPWYWCFEASDMLQLQRHLSNPGLKEWSETMDSGQKTFVRIDYCPGIRIPNKPVDELHLCKIPRTPLAWRRTRWQKQGGTKEQSCKIQFQIFKS